MNFIYLRKLLTSSSMKLELFVDVDLETLYGLMSMTSSSSTLPLFFFICFLFIYNSWIFYMFSSTYVLFLSLYLFSLSANILWIWNTRSSILLWTRLSRLQKVDLAFSYFLIFIFIFIWFIVIFLFLKLRIRVSDNIT